MFLQPDSRFALTLTDVRRDESQYGSSTRRSRQGGLKL